MLKKILCGIAASAVLFAVGCSDVPQSDPKPANGKTDPRLKPAESGGSASPAQQQATKGD